MEKSDVVKMLRDLGLLLQIRGENSFKSRAYDMGADRVSGLPEADFFARVKAGTLTELPNIGAAIAEKITEYVDTGKLEAFESARGDLPLTILDLVQLPDLGPKKAAALWKELRVGDVDALEAACKDGRVEKLKGFGAKTQTKLLEGIARFRKRNGRHLLGAVLPRAQALVERIKAVPGVQRASIAGSARRSRETVGDVDIIASSTNPAAVLKMLADDPAVNAVIGHGDNKCSVRLKPDDLQVDLRVLPDEDFATLLHHFTGSKAHHIRLRGLAQDRGLKISEWGLHEGERKIPILEEADLYRQLGMTFVPPELREDSGEVELALEGTLPTDWVREEDIQGAVHSHSTWSDGKDTLEEMARAAMARGLKYLTVTEHSPAAAYAGGLTPERLRAQWDEIDRLNAELGPNFRLLKGLEVDILEDGALDLPDALLDALEVVIASIHVRHQLDEAQMTARVLKALDHPRTHILGHPTGRLIGERDPYPLRMEAILDRAAERGVAVEVNGNPSRLDLSADHVRLAVKRGVKLVASVDAHSVDQLGNIRFSVATARRGWARKTDILNTRPAAGFLAELRAR